MSHFDQQPIEATALLLAAESAHTVTGDARYEAAMERCLCVVPRRQRPRPLRGGPRARRVLRWPHPQGVNMNEGAESTLMWLTAAEHIRAFRGCPSRRAERGAELPAMSTR